MRRGDCMLRLSRLRWLAAAVALGVSPAFGQVLADGKPVAQAAPTGVTIGPMGPMVAAPAPGQPAAPDPNEPEVFKYVITPAAEPALPLKYRFSVPSNERQAGNSVPFY